MQSMNFLKFIFTLIFVYFFQFSNAQQKINPDSIKDKMAWFEDAKLGIFIHWEI